jgi:LDH2 family malate/lactate/ureidoglycolate dehydrogenase
VVAIDIAAFMDLDTFKRQIDVVWDTMKSSPLLPGFDQIRLPGERTDQIEQENREKGVPIHPSLAPALAKLAEELGIEPL